MLYYDIKNKNTPNFTAIQLAKTKTTAKGVLTELNIYRLSRKDKSFLRQLPDSVSMDTFYPGLSKSAYKRWHEMLELAADKALKHDRESLVVCKGDKPCGIITFKPGKNTFTIDAICTWAVDSFGKVPFAGKVLFNEFFNIFKNSKANNIKLQAITDGPFPTEPIYKKLGFIPVGLDGDHLILMEFSVSKLKNILNNLSDFITRTEVKNSQDIRFN